ncbi:MAG: FAD-dependent oxidoreductase [Phycisphaerales bacterium]|nr:FAD-dependent oxidoreductase [Phycisphaerales bacterium]
MKIAIIGSGISGLVCAHRLHAAHEITVFEREAWIGGHTHTVDVRHEGRDLRVDTGFIVFNRRNYTEFDKLLDELGVESQPTDMSFSVRDEGTGFEYGGLNLNSLFAQRRNLASPRFYRMLAAILRFNREAPADVLEGNAGFETLGAYLAEKRYPREMTELYLVPMAAAVWSSPERAVLEMPLRFFVEFFKNHGMLQTRDRPQWRTIRGGSACYVEKLVSPFRERVRLRTPVESVVRDGEGVTVRAGRAGRVESERFDEVIFACHSDQALAMLGDATGQEREILGALPYQANETVLHTDASVLPKRRLAWSAWNYHIPDGSRGGGAERVLVTYNMDILQRLGCESPVCVTLNRTNRIDEGRVIASYLYHHPVYTPSGVAAQGRWGEISGRNRTHFCGAYWGYGFHEDGVRSARKASEMVEQVIR